MFDINEVTKKDYKAANPAQNVNLIKFYKKLLGLLPKITLMLLLDMLIYIFHMIVPRKRDDITKQLALVTGGGNGFGRALCFRLAQEGCDVAVVDIDHKSAAKTSLEIQQKFGIKSRAYECDISNYSALLELKAKMEKELKVVDILVNNAGLIYNADFVKSDVLDIKKVVDVNLTAQILMVHLFLPEMIEQKRGRILSISSILAINPLPASVVYTSTKYGVNGFMQCLHDELSMTDKDEFIKLTTVFPDFMSTRSEMSEMLDSIKYELPRLSPERVANEAVVGMLTNQRKVVVSDTKAGHYGMALVFKRIRKDMLKSLADIKLLFK